jgi:hypothetical protein
MPVPHWPKHWWRTTGAREDALAEAIDAVAAAQRLSQLPCPDPVLIAFHDRPYRTTSGRIPEVLMAEVTDPVVAALPVGVGSIEQSVDNVDVLCSPYARLSWTRLLATTNP